MAGEETELRRLNGRLRAEHVGVAGLLLAVLGGGGGVWSLSGVGTKLEAISVSLAEIKGGLARGDEGRVRLEARADRVEERVRALEQEVTALRARREAAK